MPAAVSRSSRASVQRRTPARTSVSRFSAGARPVQIASARNGSSGASTVFAIAAAWLCQWIHGAFSSFMFSAPFTWLSNGP